ncbi:MAG: hypothetical protein UZ22_OP11002000735 [Microgenomates bacterium OLB23]|nr:MAG: hypothetical protein UZ22_OP11002000735 [Microgenomates bacterium OLB23]
MTATSRASCRFALQTIKKMTPSVATAAPISFLGMLSRSLRNTIPIRTINIDVLLFITEITAAFSPTVYAVNMVIAERA